MPPTSHQSPASSTPLREPQLLRFRLRQMFLMVALVSVVCYALVGAQGPWPLVILITVLLVAAHVLGNLIGTRLRDTSHEVVTWRATQPGLDPDRPVKTDLPLAAAKLTLPPATPLASRERVAHWTIWYVVGGLTLGVLSGVVGIALTTGPRIEWAGWVVVAISCGVLGAWAAFLASTFSSITRHAWRHAHGRSK